MTLLRSTEVTKTPVNITAPNTKAMAPPLIVVVETASKGHKPIILIATGFRVMMRQAHCPQVLAFKFILITVSVRKKPERVYYAIHNRAGGYRRAA